MDLNFLMVKKDIGSNNSLFKDDSDLQDTNSNDVFITMMESANESSFDIDTWRNPAVITWVNIILMYVCVYVCM